MRTPPELCVCGVALQVAHGPQGVGGKGGAPKVPSLRHAALWNPLSRTRQGPVTKTFGSAMQSPTHQSRHTSASAVHVEIRVVLHASGALVGHSLAQATFQAQGFRISTATKFFFLLFGKSLKPASSRAERRLRAKALLADKDLNPVWG